VGGTDVESERGINVMRCDLCGRVEDDDRAIEAGWWPDYWVTEGIRRDKPVCPECAHEHLQGFAGVATILLTSRRTAKDFLVECRRIRRRSFGSSVTSRRRLPGVCDRLPWRDVIWLWAWDRLE
jgi:hypothetical protein